MIWKIVKITMYSVIHCASLPAGHTFFGSGFELIYYKKTTTKKPFKILFWTVSRIQHCCMGSCTAHKSRYTQLRQPKKPFSRNCVYLSLACNTPTTYSSVFPPLNCHFSILNLTKVLNLTKKWNLTDFKPSKIDWKIFLI